MHTLASGDRRQDGHSDPSEALEATHPRVRTPPYRAPGPHPVSIWNREPGPKEAGRGCACRATPHPQSAGAVSSVGFGESRRSFIAFPDLPAQFPFPWNGQGPARCHLSPSITSSKNSLKQFGAFFGGQPWTVVHRSQATARGKEALPKWEAFPVRSWRARAVAILAVMALVVALAGTGMAAFRGPGPKTLRVSRFSLAYAERQPCWAGAIKLQVQPSAAHTGEVIGLDPLGAPLHALVGGVLTTFEAPSPDGWSAAYFLSTGTWPLDGLGATPASAGYFTILPGLLGPVHVRVPDVPPGSYRLVRSYSSAPFSGTSFPRHANLCAALRVLPTSKMLSAADQVTVTRSPSGNVRNGQRVHVMLSGFGHSAPVQLFECAFAALASAQGCGVALDSGRPVRVSADGSANVTVAVHDYASAGPGQGQGRTYPCLDNCVLVATLGAGYASAGTQLAFREKTGAAGTLAEVGGPWVASSPGIPGRVNFRAVDSRARNYSSATAADGEFAILLAPGRYRVTAHSPRVISDGHPMTCLASPPVVTVQADQAAYTPITCNIK